MASLGRRYSRGALFQQDPANGKSPDTLMPGLYASLSTSCVLSSLAVALRLYVRTRVLPAFGKDDWLIIVSVIFLWATASMGVWGGQYGLGLHLKDIPADKLRRVFEVSGLLKP